MISSTYLLSSEQDKSNELHHFKETIKIDTLHPIFLADKNGNIETPFMFDQNNWMFEISTSFNEENILGCHFSLQYISDNSKILVWPKNKNKKKSSMEIIYFTYRVVKTEEYLPIF